MKFIPRQPHPPPERSVVRTTTTRFLRLQPTEETASEDAASSPVPVTSALPEPQPLPMPPETSPLPSARTASQRVRLRLDPEVATQPLPESERAAYPASTAEPAWASAVPEPLDAAAAENLAPGAGEIPPDAPTVTGEQAASVAAEPEAAYEQPVREAASFQPASNSTAPPTASPSQPIPEWLQGRSRLTPPAQPPLSLSSLARGDRPAVRRFAPRETGKEKPAPVVLPSAAATESRPLPRPELRRPSATPLAAMTRPERSLGRGFWIVLIVVILLLGAAIYFFGLLPKVAAYMGWQSRPHPAAIERTVVYAVARSAMTPVVLPLSGTIEPFQQTALYARTTGYVRDWLVDIGDPVQAGQVLAELDTPDVDHQLTQARATADEAKARLALAQDESKRWDTMAAAHAVSQQDADEKDSARDEAQAGFNAAQASVARLVDLELFKEIRAPYAGRITARNLEVGTLVTSGPGAAGNELFRVAQTDPVRVFVEVPEASAPSIQQGLTARIKVPSFPDRIFHGTVVRDAGILDGTTHALRTELRVANPDGALLPGAQAGVLLQLRDSVPAVLIPADTLISQRNELAVARLTGSGGHDVVHFTPVKVGRDFGAEVEVLDNVREGDRLVSHPPADLQDGTMVNARPLEESPIPSLLPPKPSAPRA